MNVLDFYDNVVKDADEVINVQAISIIEGAFDELARTNCTSEGMAYRKTPDECWYKLGPNPRGRAAGLALFLKMASSFLTALVFMLFHPVCAIMQEVMALDFAHQMKFCSGLLWAPQ